MQLTNIDKERDLRRVVPGRTRRDAPFGVHACLEVSPALLRDLDIARRKPPRVLPEHVKQDDEVRRPPVQDSIELASVVAAKLAQLAFNLQGVRPLPNGDEGIFGNFGWGEPDGPPPVGGAGPIQWRSMVRSSGSTNRHRASTRSRTVTR
jgi:hypothetical protein